MAALNWPAVAAVLTSMWQTAFPGAISVRCHLCCANGDTVNSNRQHGVYDDKALEPKDKLKWAHWAPVHHGSCVPVNGGMIFYSIDPFRSQMVNHFGLQLLTLSNWLAVISSRLSQRQTSHESTDSLPQLLYNHCFLHYIFSLRHCFSAVV